MKLAILLLTLISLSACQPMTELPDKPHIVSDDQIQTWLAKDPGLSKRLYPTPITFNANKYQVELFADFIRYIHTIKHNGLSSPIDSYAKTDSRDDEIARRYSDIVSRRGNRIQAQTKAVNQLITHYVNVKPKHNHYQRNNLDEALIEYTPEGEPVSMLVRANLFSTSFNINQIVNTYQIQQSFIIYGPKVKTIARKLKFEIRPPATQR